MLNGLKKTRWHILLCLIVVAGHFFCSTTLYAQHPDSTKTKKSLTKKAFKAGMGYISTTPKDTIINETSVDINKQFEQKIIRTIYLEHIGFERSIYDTTKRTRKIVADIADALHGTTREQIIRQHLFVKKNTPLNPYLLADNERFLRDLDFILDCRIVVTPIPEQPDSVDVVVITRDVFSLGIRIGGTIPTAPKIGIYDANLAGYGQRLDFTALIDPELDPAFTYAAYYRKSSIFRSLANVEVGYTQLNGGRSYGDETEYAYYLRVTRPLVSPYSRLAGGFEVSNNWSVNTEKKPDSVFLKYNYKISDVWIGYNFGMKRNFSNRNRIFLAGRFFDGVYVNPPDQTEYEEEIKYNSTKGYLTELTFYRQNFYRTRYLFGFGRTEDVPYGMSLSIAGGYIKEVRLERPYMGIKWYRSWASRKGNIFNFTAQTGGYWHTDEAEDLVLTTGAMYITRAWNMQKTKVRTLLAAGYSKIYNRNIATLMEIKDSDLNGFSADSVFGGSKAFGRMETAFYTPWQVIGFRFAPFVGVSAAWMDCLTCEDKSTLFWGFSTGFRTRNENLIFGTIELRITYIPANDVTGSQFAFDFKQRLKIKNSGTFVKPPSLVQY
ncbi:MAG: hypothetical protein JNM57_07750 [Cyclobacteriaceae bacterium]|nr:hypothetical protein [Cyclobacteriaceae bacterium]